MTKLSIFRPVRMSVDLDELILAAANARNSTRSDIIRQCCELVLVNDGGNVSIGTILELRNAAIEKS